MKEFYDYETGLSDEKKKEMGIVYTPLHIVEFINQEILSGWTEASPPKVLDPCCGTGVFLYDMAQRIAARWSLPLAEVYEKYIYGFDLDPDGAAICRQNLPGATIEVADSLNASYDFCDMVVTNPPYVRIQNLTSEQRADIKKNWEFCIGDTDLYMAFFEKLARLQKPVGMICPNSWIRNKFAYKLRDYLFDQRKVSHLVDFKEKKVFPNAMVYASIVIMPTGIQSRLSYSNDLKRRWIPFTYEKSDSNHVFLGLKMSSKTGRRLLDVCNVSIGLATLGDRIYFGEVVERRPATSNEGELCLFQTKHESTWVEAPTLRRCIKASRHSQIKENTYVIFPYDEKKQLLSEDVLRTNYPRLYAYLSHHKEKLLARDKGGIPPAQWYAFGRTQGLSNDREKILIPPFQKDCLRVRHSSAGEYYLSGYAVTPKEGYTLTDVERWLSSDELWEWLEPRGKSLSSGWVGLSKQTFFDYRISNIEEGSDGG